MWSPSVTATVARLAFLSCLWLGQGVNDVHVPDVGERLGCHMPAAAFVKAAPSAATVRYRGHQHESGRAPLQAAVFMDLTGFWHSFMIFGPL